MMKKNFSLLCFSIIATIVFSQNIEKLTKKELIEDIKFLKDNTYSTIPQADKRIDNKIFEQQFNDLTKKVSSASYDADAIVLHMQMLLSLVNDEGCNIYPFQKALEYPILPIKTYWFSDGLYICDATKSNQQLIGKQIIKINEVPISEIYEKLKQVLPADNDHYKKYLFSMYTLIPAWLNYAGILNNKDVVIIHFADGNKTELAFEPIASYISLKRQLAGYRQINGSSLNHNKENYWMEYLPDGETLFIQFLQISHQEDGLSFKKFVTAISKEIQSGKATKLIIDNRYGGGGNGFKLKPFTDLIRDNKNINQHGKLFVLTSRSTRGTVLELTSILQLNTKAILVGEPTGEGPNLVGDTKNITLPNSNIQVSLTHTFWPTSFEFDVRKFISPHIKINYAHVDYLSGHDPWLDAVYSADIKKPKGAIPSANLIKPLVGKHTISDQTFRIIEENGRFFMKIDRKMKSFFELKTELHYVKNGVLETDIHWIDITYKLHENSSPTLKFQWFSNPLE